MTLVFSSSSDLSVWPNPSYSSHSEHGKSFVQAGWHKMYKTAHQPQTVCESVWVSEWDCAFRQTEKLRDHLRTRRKKEINKRDSRGGKRRRHEGERWRWMRNDEGREKDMERRKEIERNCGSVNSLSLTQLTSTNTHTHKHAKADIARCWGCHIDATHGSQTVPRHIYHIRSSTLIHLHSSGAAWRCRTLV